MALEEAEGHASNIRRILVSSAILQLLHFYYGHIHTTTLTAIYIENVRK